ncbi:MAG: hypothetical protein CMF38_06660 [Legionellaceae bacterium]|nr:hypothetical protein [Legionellaceae bacterium]HAF87610.1 hypothetical protein [Legionellales bacterium]|tara:strand:- start:177 stop:638 length:462 start_codon:yes stop_codon:yes gene_type:complete
MHHKGFTLVEILVVIIILSIISGVTLIAFGDFGQSRQAQLSAEQFKQYIELIEERALLQMATFEVYVTQKGYKTRQLINHTTWLEPRQHLFKWHVFPKASHVSWPDEAASSYRILINATGETTPFTLFFGTATAPRLLTLKGRNNGQIDLYDA